MSRTRIDPSLINPLSSNISFSPSTNGITGTTAGDNATAGTVGEYVSSFAGATNAPTNNDMGDLTSIVLTAGDWDISYNAIFNVNSATLATQFGIQAGISTTSGNSYAGLIIGQNYTYFYGAAGLITALGSGGDVPLCISGYRLSISSTTTVYAKMLWYNYTSGTPTVTGGLQARRVR